MYSYLTSFYPWLGSLADFLTQHRREVVLLAGLGLGLSLAVCRLSPVFGQLVYRQLGQQAYLRSAFLVFYPLRCLFLWQSWGLGTYLGVLGLIWLLLRLFPSLSILVIFLYQGFWDVVVHRTATLTWLSGGARDLVWYRLALGALYWRLRFRDLVVFWMVVRLVGLPLLPNEIYYPLIADPTLGWLFFLWFTLLFVLSWMGLLLVPRTLQQDYPAHVFQFYARERARPIQAYLDVPQSAFARFFRWIFRRPVDFRPLPGGLTARMNGRILLELQTRLLDAERGGRFCLPLLDLSSFTGYRVTLFQESDRQQLLVRIVVLLRRLHRLIVGDQTR